MSSTDVGAPRRSAALSQIGFVVGFLPWIVFSFVAQRLAANGVAWSALLAVAMTVVALLFAYRRHGPKILNLCSLVLFTVIAVAGFVGGAGVDEWLFDWGRPLVGVVLGLFVLATVPILPFTAEYARQSTPREYWDSPLFVRINRVLSATWGVALIVIGAAALVVAAFDAHAAGTGSDHLVDLALNWVVPIAVLWWTVRFTLTYPDRASAGATEG